MHPTSIPGGVCGTFGRGAKEWIKTLNKHGIEYWQFLPLTPTDSTGSPYSSPSSFALNPWFLDLDDLIFAWKIVKHVTSNAIVIVKDGQTLGVGAGQTSRVDSVKIAAAKAARKTNRTSA